MQKISLKTLLKINFFFTAYWTVLYASAAGNLGNQEILGGIEIPPSIYNSQSNNDFLYNDTQHSIGATTEHNRIPSLLSLLAQYPNGAPPLLIGIKAEFDAAYSDNTQLTYVPPFNGYDPEKHSATHVWFDKWRLPIVATYQDAWHLEVQPQAKGSDLTILEGSVFYGDLTKSSLYAYLGREYIDFAPFNTFIPYNDPLNKNYFRPLPQDTASVGFENKNILSEFSFFRTDSTNSGDQQLNNFAYEFLYRFNLPNSNNFKLGASYIENINNTQAGLSNLTSSDDGLLPAVDLNAYLTWQPFGILAEYDSTTKKVNNIDNNNVLISAYDLELAYNQSIFNKPTTFSMSYSKTQGLNGVDGAGFNSQFSETLLGDNDMFSASIAMEFAQNFYLSLEADRVSQYTELSTSSPKGYFNIVTADCVWFF